MDPAAGWLWLESCFDLPIAFQSPQGGEGGDYPTWSRQKLIFKTLPSEGGGEGHSREYDFQSDAPINRVQGHRSGFAAKSSKVKHRDVGGLITCHSPAAAHRCPSRQPRTWGPTRSARVLEAGPVRPRKDTPSMQGHVTQQLPALQSRGSASLSLNAQVPAGLVVRV